jgi:hypothetical protein
MLRKRQPSSSDIDKALKTLASDAGTPVKGVQRLHPNHWQLDMVNKAGQYPMSVINQRKHITYAAPLTAAPLTPDVEGKNEAAFLREVLRYSGKMNGPHIAIEDDTLILTKEDQKEGLGLLGISQSIRQVNETHQVAYPAIVEMEKKHFGNKKR